MRVLVCKVGGLGDTVSILPVVAALADEGMPVTVLCAPPVIPLVQAVAPVRCVPADPARVAGVRGLAAVPELARRVGAVDVALLSFDEPSAVHACAALVARRRVGFASGVARGAAFLDEALPFDPLRNVYDLTFDLARHLTGRDLPLRRPRLRLTQPEKWLRLHGLRPGHPFGVVHAGAAHVLQRWQEPAYRRTIDRLSMGGHRWLPLSEADGLDAAEVAAVLSAATGFLGNHSGLLHLSALVGTPYVAVAGPTSPSWDPPWAEVPGLVIRAGLSCQPCGRLGAPARRCPHDPYPPCLGELDPDGVAARVEGVMRLDRAG